MAPAPMAIEEDDACSPRSATDSATGGAASVGGGQDRSVPPESAASRAAAAALASGKPVKPLAQCSYCGMTFRKLEHCQRHERTHTLDRPYACSVCAKTFARQDTLNRHVRLHTRAEDGAPAKPRRRRIKPISTDGNPNGGSGASSGPRTFIARRTSLEAKGANGFAQPLPSPASSLSAPLTPASAPAHLGLVDGFGHLRPDPPHAPHSRRNSDAGPTSYLHRHHFLQQNHPAMFLPNLADADEIAHQQHGSGRARERGFSLSAIDETAAHHQHHTGHGGGLQVLGAPYQIVSHPSRPAYIMPSSQPEVCPTSLLAQYPLPSPDRPGLFVGTSEKLDADHAGGVHWDVSGWVGGHPGSAHSLSSFSSEQMLDQSPTFAGMVPFEGGPAAPIGSDVTSPSDSSAGSENASRKASVALAAMGQGGENSFGLTGVALEGAHQPPTMAGEGPARGTLSTADWMRYLAAHELAHPTYQRLMAPTMLADGTQMRGGSPSPFLGSNPPMMPDIEMAAPHSFGRIPSPYDGSAIAPSPPGSSCASHRGYGSSGGDSIASGMFSGPGPIHRPHLNGFRPGSTGSSVFTRDRVSLSSSLQTDVSAGGESWRSGKNNDEDPTLAPADLARSRSSNQGVPYSFEGLQATAPGIPHLGMPNSLSFLAFSPEASVQGPAPSGPPSGVHLGEAVDDWRARMQRLCPPTLDGSGPGRHDPTVFRTGGGASSHPVRASDSMFLPLLDHDTTPNASAPASASGFAHHVAKTAGMLTPAMGPAHDRMSERTGFFRADSQATAQPVPTQQLQPGKSSWPLTPDPSPPSTQTDPTSSMGRIEDASAARDSMRIDLEDLVAVELAA